MRECWQRLDSWHTLLCLITDSYDNFADHTLNFTAEPGERGAVTIANLIDQSFHSGRFCLVTFEYIICKFTALKMLQF